VWEPLHGLLCLTDDHRLVQHDVGVEFGAFFSHPKGDVFKADFVTVVQGFGSGNFDAVDTGAIGRTEVFYFQGIIFYQQFGLATRNIRAQQGDFTLQNEANYL